MAATELHNERARTVISETRKWSVAIFDRDRAKTAAGLMVVWVRTGRQIRHALSMTRTLAETKHVCNAVALGQTGGGGVDT